MTANVPYGKTPLPVWFFRPDDSGKQRPTVILTNGSDGQNVDMWAYGVSAALDRDWNALVYDGPGQGQLLFVDRVVFTPRWETVVTPLVDWLVARSDVDADRVALTGLSMAGNLARGPRPSRSGSPPWWRCPDAWNPGWASRRRSERSSPRAR